MKSSALKMERRRGGNFPSVVYVVEIRAGREAGVLAQSHRIRWPILNTCWKTRFSKPYLSSTEAQVPTYMHTCISSLCQLAVKSIIWACGSCVVLWLDSVTPLFQQLNVLLLIHSTVNHYKDALFEKRLQLIFLNVPICEVITTIFQKAGY